MLTIEEALSRVIAAATPLAPERVALVDALGRRLAEDAVSDVDSPPHDKALVDGYAVRAAEVGRDVELEVVEQITAGQTPSRSLSGGQAARIMTGAPIPEGADAVVMVERTTPCGSPTRVRLQLERAAVGDCILRRAAAMRAGERVVARGRELRPMEIGLLAEAGCAQVLVEPHPAVAVLATGDELVEHTQRPAAGQIRNSNSPMLAALVTRAGGLARDLGIAGDERQELTAAIRQGLEADVLILSGGVSAGVLDLTPAVLLDLGVEPIFHKIRLKPGKPLWFGRKMAHDRTTLVFGLPGNPVSSLVCFELFVRPALELLAGRPAAIDSRRRPAVLGTSFTHRGDRPTCFPASLQESSGGPALATPLAWKGSADLRTLADAQALILFPAGDREYTAGEPTEVYIL